MPLSSALGSKDFSYRLIGKPYDSKTMKPQIE